MKFAQSGPTFYMRTGSQCLFGQINEYLFPKHSGKKLSKRISIYVASKLNFCSATWRVSYERFQDHPKGRTLARTKFTEEKVFKMMPNC